MSGAIVFIVAGLYACFLFYIAHWAKARDGGQLSSKTRFFAYSFALGVYCTSWTFFGAVGSAYSQGWPYLPIYLGPILLFLFGYRFLERLIEAVKLEGATSISHFIGSRYSNSRGVAALVTIAAALGIIPYLALQLRSVGTSFVRLTAGSDLIGPMALTAVVLTIFALLFGTRTYDQASRNNGVLLAVAVESIVKLLAFVAVGVFATFAFFASSNAQQMVGIDQMLALFDPHKLNGDFLVFGALASFAIIALPRQFYVTVIQADGPNDLTRARKPFLIYLIVTSLIAVPIALAGLTIMPGETRPDLLVIDMPLAFNQNLLALLVFVGGFSAATGMVIVETIALSTMVSNDLIAPFLLQSPRWSRTTNFGKTMLVIRRVVIIVTMAVAFLYALAIPPDRSLANIGLIGFAAVAQFAPVLIFSVIAPNRDVTACKAALFSGLIIWAYTLFIPAIVEPRLLVSLKDTLIDPQGLLGISGINTITHGTIWSLGINLSVYGLVAARRLRAPRISIDFSANNSASHGIVRTQDDLINLVSRFVGKDEAEKHLRKFNFGSNELERVAARTAERLIASVVGAPSARALMSSALAGASLSAKEVAQLLDNSGQSLQFSKDLLASIVEHIDPGVSVVDRNLNLVAWNRRYLDLFNYPPGMVHIGAAVADLIRYNAIQGECGPGEVENHVARRLSHMRRRQTHSFERNRADGRVFKTVGGPMPDGGYVMCFTDITIEAQARNTLEKSRQELEQMVELRTVELSKANKALGEAMGDKTRFLAAASHDLLQPLHSAKLFSSALERKITGSELAILYKIEQSIESAEKLLRRLLDISKLDAGGVVPQFRDVHIKDKMQEVVDIFLPLANEKNLHLKLAGGNYYTSTDPTLLRSIVQNLVSNAVRYTKTGGILIGVRKRNKRLIIEVYDTGIGIPPTKLKSIFREFERLETGDEAGIGLGLSIVERTARLLNAKIEVKSIEGRGSRFSVILPLKKPKDVEKLSSESRAFVQQEQLSLIPTAANKQLKFLIVDNDKQVCDAMATLVQSLGYDTDIAYSGKNILEGISNFDGIFLDYDLAEEDNGIDLARKIIGNQKDAKIATITAHSIPRIKDIEAELGIKILKKPLDTKKLLSWLNANFSHNSQ